ncbi:unnamed protein product [Meganyctiphanes norvegica]|uniref:Uncharacterized protein n=1 Tax=Meganyctiphanes norvegica TaxID=48144 RepID=A0AAV2RVB0_MEGNR
MIRAIRANTYKTQQLPILNSEFYDFHAAEDEQAASLLEYHITGIVKKATKTKLKELHTVQQDETKLLSAAKKLAGLSNSMNVLMAADFMPRMVRDIMRMSEGEANGIRSCTLVLQYLDGFNKVVLGKIVCDPKMEQSCTMHVKLVRAQIPEEEIQNFSLFSLLGSKPSEDIYISPGYTIEKKSKTRRVKLS